MEITLNEMLDIVSAVPGKTLDFYADATRAHVSEHPDQLAGGLSAMLMITEALARRASGMQKALEAMPADTTFDLDSARGFLYAKPSDAEFNDLTTIVMKASHGPHSVKVGAHLIVDAVGLMVKEFEDAMVALAATKAVANV